MIYLITDTHLGHTAIARYCNRPKDFSDLIIHNLKAVLKKEDTLIHLGDVAFNSAYMEKFLYPLLFYASAHYYQILE